MRFLMNTLLAHPRPSLIHAFPAKTLWARSTLTTVFVSLRSPLSRSEVTDVAQLQLSIFWRQFSPAFQSCWHTKIRIQNRSLPRLRLIARGTFPRRSSNVRVGFVQPSSRFPRSPHLKSHARKRRPTRLKVMTGKSETG